MDVTLTVEEFNQLLKADRDHDENSLLKTLRQLAGIEQTERVRLLADDKPDMTGWLGWGF